MDRAIAAALVAGDAEPSLRLRFFVQRILPWVLSALAFWFVLRDLNAHEIFSSFAHIQWFWAICAILLDVMTYVLQGVRWSVLLRPLGRLSPSQTTQAIYVGLFANEILPLRAGEVIRGLLAAGRLNVGAFRVIPSMVSERLLDGVWLALAVAWTAHSIPLPPALATAATIFFTLAIAASIAFFAYRLVRNQASPWHQLAIAAVCSGGIIVAQVSAFWFALRSCGLNTTFWAGGAALVVIRLGTLLPGAPANIGTYQFFCVLGLSLIGVARSAAASFSIVVFVMLTLPLWTLGLVALGRTGQSLHQLRQGVAHE